MVTGASRAQIAILVIDAKEGVQENSRRHAVMLSMLGIQQVVVVINKMDLVNYKQEVYEAIVQEFDQFLSQLDVKVQSFLPVSAMQGQNLVTTPDQMKWFKADSLMQTLDNLRLDEIAELDNFRMPVQGVYKFTQFEDDRRIVAGNVTSGLATEGQRLVFYPSMKTARIKSVEGFSKSSSKNIKKGDSCGFTLEPQVYVPRGEIACVEGEPSPKVSRYIKVNLFWLGRLDLVKGKDYLLKLGTNKVVCQVHEIIKVLDASELKSLSPNSVKRNQIAECILRCKQSIAFDLSETGLETSRFIIVDQYDISGGGLILDAGVDEQAWLREKIILRNKKWVYSDIKPLERARRYNQKACLF